jgi:predicted anti-sigma-YlaC factor YlaD
VRIEATVSCERIKERLSDYLDGDLPPLTRLSTAFHLRHCDACRAVLYSLEQTVCLLRRVKRDEEPPPG